MKKIVLMLSVFSLCAQTSFAQEPVLAFEDSQMQTEEMNFEPSYNLDDAAQSLPEDRLAISNDGRKSNDGDIIAGIIIGGIIGAIAADAYDRDDRHHRPQRPHNYVCYARNARGYVFRATGRAPRNVQNRAVDRCYDQSVSCRPMGCQRY